MGHVAKLRELSIYQQSGCPRTDALVSSVSVHHWRNTLLPMHTVSRYTRWVMGMWINKRRWRVPHKHDALTRRSSHQILRAVVQARS